MEPNLTMKDVQEAERMSSDFLIIPFFSASSFSPSALFVHCLKHCPQSDSGTWTWAGQ